MENPLGHKTTTEDPIINTTSFPQESIDYSSTFPVLLFCLWNVIWLASLALSIFQFGVSKLATGSCGFLIIVGILYFIRNISTKSNNYSA